MENVLKNNIVSHLGMMKSLMKNLINKANMKMKRLGLKRVIGRFNKTGSLEGLSGLSEDDLALVVGYVIKLDALCLISLDRVSSFVLFLLEKEQMTDLLFDQLLRLGLDSRVNPSILNMIYSKGQFSAKQFSYIYDLIDELKVNGRVGAHDAYINSFSLNTKLPRDIALKIFDDMSVNHGKVSNLAMCESLSGEDVIFLIKKYGKSRNVYLFSFLTKAITRPLSVSSLSEIYHNYTDKKIREIISNNPNFKNPAKAILEQFNN